LDDLVGDVPDQERPEARPASGADHDRPGVELVRVGEDRFLDRAVDLDRPAVRVETGFARDCSSP
jgi:hypothetical protein